LTYFITGFGITFIGVMFSGIISPPFITYLISFIGTMLSSLGYIYFIVSIAQKKHKTFLWLGFALGASASFINLVNSVISSSDIGINILLSIIVIFAGIMGLTSSILTLLAYRGTYLGIRNGIIQPLFQCYPHPYGRVVFKLDTTDYGSRYPKDFSPTHHHKKYHQWNHNGRGDHEFDTMDTDIIKWERQYK